MIKPAKSELLQKMLDYSAARQKALANNIANINTPGYKRIDVEFDKELSSVIAKKDRHAIRKLGFKYVQDESSPMRKDKNTVDVDIEMAKLSENALVFNIYSVLLKRKFQGLKKAIKGS